MKKVLITGLTSFTGSHIGKAFCDAGWHVVGTFTQTLDVYQANPLLSARMQHSGAKDWIENASFGSPSMLDAISHYSPEIFVNHGASIKGYRLPNFDHLASVQNATANATGVMNALKQNGCKRFIHSGSIFEGGEGSGNGYDEQNDAMSIYGVSKSLSWDILRFYSAQVKLPVTKVVIPNPVGEMENPDRLFPRFAQSWLANKKPSLRTPSLVRDNIPANWLANVYVKAAQDNSSLAVIHRPSGFKMTNEEFLNKFLKELKNAGGPAHLFDVQNQDTGEALKRINGESCPELGNTKEENKFWTNWFRSLKLI